MTNWIDLGQAQLPGGDRLTLRRRGGDFEIRFNLLELMSSRDPTSERALATLACDRVDRRSAHVLIGGLGLGYTVRAVLDGLGPEGRVTVAELIPDIVAWNRGPLAGLAAHPLEDDRVALHEGDVADLVAASQGAFDAVLIDVDNGPEAVLFEANRPLYSKSGIATILASLKPGGILALWAAERSPGFERVPEGGAFGFERVDIKVEGLPGPGHSIYLVEARP